MKSYTSRFQNLFSLLRGILLVLLLVALVGCSGGSNQPETNPTEGVAEVDELKAENEELQAELEKAMEALKEAESRVVGLESDLEALQEAQATPSPSPSAQIDLVAPERTPSELLLGEWFLPEFYEESDVSNYTISLVFNSEGSGTQIQTFYLPSELNADNYATSDPSGEYTSPFTWSIDGDTVHTEFGIDVVDFTFSLEQQQLLLISINGEKPGNEQTYVREAPAIPAEFVKKSVIVNDIQAQEAALMRRFWGTWYFDITTWTFNEDGTGVWDIPEVANQPAAKREFTYSVMKNADDPMLAIDWIDTSETAIILTKKNSDGSITLGDELKLTRQFDATNCPLSTQMIQTGIDVFTGRMFYDMLGIEE